VVSKQRPHRELMMIIALSLIFVASLTANSPLVEQYARAASQSTGRVLSISSNPRTGPGTAPQDFLAAIDLAYQAGARGNFVSWTWKALEPSPGRFHLDEVKNGLNYLGNTRGFELLIGIQVLNTTAKETPSDLADIPFDASAMKTRFHALLDALRPYLNRHVKYFSIGNEVDVYLSAHPMSGLHMRRSIMMLAPTCTGSLHGSREASPSRMMGGWRIGRRFKI